MAAIAPSPAMMMHRNLLEGRDQISMLTYVKARARQSVQQ
jgi:hypothetical protein